MSKKFEIFDSAKLRLTKGVNFVEASAGTGKTYSITMLVLRALVELDIPIEKILIVTFTKAATEELRSRIRERLIEVRAILLTSVPESLAVDTTLLDWLVDIKDHGRALAKIQHALYDIDRAGVFTIHGFCQRMLGEQAMESGQLFDVELLTSVDNIRRRMVDDFWRKEIYPLSELACSVFIDSFPSPDRLLSSVSECTSGNCRLEPVAEESILLINELNLNFVKISKWWQSCGDELKKLFSQGIEGGFFKKTVTENFASWFRDVDSFFSGKVRSLPSNLSFLTLDGLMAELNGTKLRGNQKKKEFLQDWPLSEGLVEPFICGAEQLVLSLRLSLASELPRQLALSLEEQGCMGFDDLIKRLSTSLKNDNDGNLHGVLSKKYSVVLVDEFQDTDSDQYHIFSTLFGQGGHYLYLIGDPKQAIYKFRGADIHSYFLASNSADTLLTLDRNFRSHPALVEEVNRLFLSRPKPFWFDENVLSYRKVSPARGSDDPEFFFTTGVSPGIKYCQLAEDPKSKSGRWSSSKAAVQIQLFVKNEIIRLLGSGHQSSHEDIDSPTEVGPQHIAILVRSNKHAEEYRQTLVSAGVPAVVGSSRSVYQTKECEELYLLLQAINSPGNLTPLKTAMTISWFGLNGDELYQLWNNAEAVSLWHERFLNYHLLWRDQGILKMINKLVEDEEVIHQLARLPMAERSIANVQQLFELLQVEESERDLGASQLIQWLQRVRQGDLDGVDGELLLESDDNAVQIVTMHSAKGLEYPIVFCPYLWYRSNRLQTEKYQVKCNTESHETVLDLGSNLFVERKQQAIAEQMAEDLRLLYVAVTRAQVCCYTMWADVQGRGMVGDSFQSALGYLLFPNGQCSHDEQRDFLTGLSSESPVDHEMIVENHEPLSYNKKMAVSGLMAETPSARSLATDWQTSSFSGLATLSEYGPQLHSPLHSVRKSDSISLPHLPAGPHFGNVIHDLLEANIFSQLGKEDRSSELEDMVQAKCGRYGVEADSLELIQLLRSVVTTPLNARVSTDNFCLAELADDRCLKEMEFYFKLGRLETEQINHILSEEKSVATLGHKEMKGYLTGFVDLVCEFNNKYYIIDYKTNFLGVDTVDYRPSNLEVAMASHNYGLQYWIYTLVLHRHLCNILPGYKYGENFGGVLYLFVRGMSPGVAGSGVYYALPKYERLLQLNDAFGGGER